MAYAHKNLKITFGGRLYGNQEIWTNGLTVGHEDKDFDGFVYQGDDVTRRAIRDAIVEWFTSRDAYISQDAKLEWVKFAVIGTDGKYAVGDDGGYELNETLDFDAYSGGEDRQVAPQLSVALTLETAVRRGAGRYGRIYPPLTGVSGTDGYDVHYQSRASAFAKLINDINDCMDGPLTDDSVQPRVIVASNVGSGRNATVANIKVGKVIDTQRSRRNALTEDYTVLPITPNNNEV